MISDDQLLSSYVFDLPETFIAQRPVEPRHAARLLALEGPEGCRHQTVWDLQELLKPG
ncbi:MAG: S-adenosylmethionine:tRNA ribosyltransferase-isomerase, partial [Vulcanococcus sp.]